MSCHAKYVYVNTRVDYQHRSVSLDDMCLYDYISFYRKKPIDARDRKQLKAQSEAKSTEPSESRRGRPSPVLLGPPVPRKDRDDMRERYCRSNMGRSVSNSSSKNITYVMENY